MYLSAGFSGLHLWKGAQREGDHQKADPAAKGRTGREPAFEEFQASGV